MARQWEALGAQRLHVVDLNGAVNGKPHNMEHVRAIAAAVSIPIHVGGGIRSLAVMKDYFSHGVSDVVLGNGRVGKQDVSRRGLRLFSRQDFCRGRRQTGKSRVAWLDESFRVNG